MSLFKKLFWVSILLWYRVEDIVEWVDNSFELALLEKIDLFLIISELMSMFILNENWAIWRGCRLEAEVKNNLFANFLISTTI